MSDWLTYIVDVAQLGISVGILTVLVVLAEAFAVVVSALLRLEALVDLAVLNLASWRVCLLHHHRLLLLLLLLHHLGL